MERIYVSLWEVLCVFARKIHTYTAHIAACGEPFVKWELLPSQVPSRFHSMSCLDLGSSQVKPGFLPQQGGSGLACVAPPSCSKFLHISSFSRGPTIERVGQMPQAQRQ